LTGFTNKKRCEKEHFGKGEAKKFRVNQLKCPQLGNGEGQVKCMNDVRGNSGQ